MTKISAYCNNSIESEKLKYVVTVKGFLKANDTNDIGVFGQRFSNQKFQEIDTKKMLYYFIK